MIYTWTSDNECWSKTHWISFTKHYTSSFHYTFSFPYLYLERNQRTIEKSDVSRGELTCNHFKNRKSMQIYLYKRINQAYKNNSMNDHTVFTVGRDWSRISLQFTLTFYRPWRNWKRYLTFASTENFIKNTSIFSIVVLEIRDRSSVKMFIQKYNFEIKTREAGPIRFFENWK